MIGQRIRDRLTATGISQAELARRVGISQPAINGLIRGSSRSSTHLHKIARALLTTPAYLEGEIDDPEEGAPLPPPAAPAAIYLRVELPTEEALTEMFDALLEGVEFAESRRERAMLLARRLPIGLAQLHDARPAAVRGHRRRAAALEGADEAASTHPRGPRT